MAGGFYRDSSAYNPLLQQAAAASARAGQYGVQAAQAFKPGDILQSYVDKRQKQEALDAQAKQQEFANKLAQDRLDIAKTSAKEASAQRDLINSRYDTQEAKAEATNQALFATLNPEVYGSSKLKKEQAAIESSILALPKAEQADVREQLMKNYDPASSKDSWVTYATTRDGIDAKTLTEAKNADYNRKVSTPGTAEYIAANKANMANQLNLFRQKKQIEQQYKPKPKPKEVNVPMFIKNPDGSLVSMNVPQSQVKGMYANGWQAGNWSKGSMKEGATKEDVKLFNKAESELNETIGLLGNSEKVRKIWAKAKGKGMHPNTFLNTIKSQGGTTAPDFWSLDVGKRDIDTSVIDKWLEGKSNSSSSSSSKTTPILSPQPQSPSSSVTTSSTPADNAILGTKAAPSEENIALVNNAIKKANSRNTEAVVKQFTQEMSNSGFAPMSDRSKEQWRTLGYILNIPFEVLRDIGKKYGPAG